MSSFELVNAPDSTPFSCFCGTGGQAPFVRTAIARPGGGVYFICATCARRIMVAYGVVMKADVDAVQEQLRVANEQLVEFAAAIRRGDVLQAEVANKEAELELLRAENISLRTAHAEAERDIQDLENGLMPRSRVPAAAASVVADALAEIEDAEHDGEEATPAKKPAAARVSDG